MRLYLIFAALLGVVSSYVWGRVDQHKMEVGLRAREAIIAQVAADASRRAAVEAIQQIDVKSVTIHRALEKEVVEVPVYRDCVHSDFSWGLLNSAYSLFDAGPSFSPSLPQAGPAP